MNVARLSLDLQKILEGKRALRRDLAARPVAEKLRMLDALRERELAIRGHGARSDSSTAREGPKPYLNKPEWFASRNRSPNGAKESSSEQEARRRRLTSRIPKHFNH